MRARGLKCDTGHGDQDFEMSRPMRARGLKFEKQFERSHAVVSRPMRARGLKLCAVNTALQMRCVAPHAGAWIEIQSYRACRRACRRRAPCGRVD